MASKEKAAAEAKVDKAKKDTEAKEKAASEAKLKETETQKMAQFEN